MQYLPPVPAIIQEYKQVSPSTSSFSKNIDCFDEKPTVKSLEDCIWNGIDEHLKNRSLSFSGTASSNVSPYVSPSAAPEI